MELCRIKCYSSQQISYSTQKKFYFMSRFLIPQVISRIERGVFFGFIRHLSLFIPRCPVLFLTFPRTVLPKSQEDIFKCNLIYFSTFQPLELGSEADNPCNPWRWSKCCTSLVHGTLKSHPKKSQSYTCGTLSMFFARRPWHHAFWMGILPTWFPIRKEARAGISPMGNVTHNLVQATEALFMRSTCRCGALGEESRGVWVWRTLPKRVQKGLKKGDDRLPQQKSQENLSNNLILHKSTWLQKAMFYSTTCTCFSPSDIHQFHIIPHMIFLFHAKTNFVPPNMWVLVC